MNGILFDNDIGAQNHVISSIFDTSLNDISTANIKNYGNYSETGQFLTGRSKYTYLSHRSEWLALK